MLKVTIFGNVSLTNGTVTLGEEDIRANKLVQLLIYMICNRETVVTGKQLSEQFWSGNSRNPGNPENALKNLMYRLRSVLKLLGPEEYIRTCRGGYQWNPEIALETDYEQLARGSRRGGREFSGLHSVAEGARGERHERTFALRRLRP